MTGKTVFQSGSSGKRKQPLNWVLGLLMTLLCGAAAAGDVTVHVSKDGADVAGATLYAFDDTGTYLNVAKTTDANGSATFTIADGTNVKFRYASNGTQLWSGLTQSPGNAEFTIPSDTTVTVTKGGTALQSLTVYAFAEDGTYLSYSRTTDANGIARFSLAAGQNVKFRVSNGGVQHWSDVVTTAADVALTVPADTVVTVTKGGVPVVNRTIYAFSEAGAYLNYSRTTDANGVVNFALAEGQNVKFRVSDGGVYHWTDVVTTAANVALAIPQDTVVTVTKGGSAMANLTVYAFSEAGAYLNYSRTTDTNGVANFALAEGQNVKFRVSDGGVEHWSDLATTAANVVLQVPADTVVNVTKNSQPVASLTVYAFSSDGTYLNYSRTTDANGTARFALAEGQDVKFRVTDGGVYNWSDVVTTPATVNFGLPNATVVTVTKAGAAMANLTVYAFAEDGTYLNYSRTTDANGVAEFSIDSGANVKFRVSDGGVHHWSDVSTAPANVALQVPADTVVTLTKGGQIVAGRTVYAFAEDGTYLSYSRTTDTNGIARFALAEGQNVKFRVSDGGVQHWSSVVTTAANVALDIPADTVVTVTKGGAAVSGLTVYAFAEDGTYLNYSRATDANGTASFAIATGQNVKFRVSNQGVDHWSAVTTTPDAVALQIPADTTVTVVKNGQPVQSLTVYAFAEDGTYLSYSRTTDAEGIARFALTNGTNAKFRITDEGEHYWSSVVTCPAGTTIWLGSAALTAVADQTFRRGDSVTAISPLTVYSGGPDAVTAASDIRIRIPASFPMVWDESDTSAVISGTGAAKTSSTVTYKDAGKTLVINVTADFAGESIAIAGLALKGFSAVAAADRLELELDNAGTVAAECDKTVSIIERQALLASAESQDFTVGAAATPISAITVTAGSGAEAVTAASDIRITIPAGLNLTWDPTDVTAVLDGDAAAKANAAVTFEDGNKTLVIDVTADLEPGETITISELAFANFTAASDPDALELELDNAGTVAAEDSASLSVSDQEVLIASAADQYFAVGQAAAPNSPITITCGTGSNVITAANDIRITIPEGFGAVWDAADVTATMAGTAAAKVAATVAYEDDGRTLVVDVTADFAAGDTLTISDLAFTNFAASEYAGNLSLEIDNADTVAAVDEKTLNIAEPEAVLASVSDQTFTVGDADAEMAPAEITSGLGAELVTAAGDIRITIPAGFGMVWDSTITEITVIGSADTKVATTVTYEDSDRTLVVDVTEDFTPGESITAFGAVFKNFATASAADNLELELDNAGTVAATDTKAITVEDRSAVISSTDSQSLAAGATSYLLPIDITAGSGANAVTAANDIRIRIPAGFNAVWDTSNATIEVVGDFSDNVATTITFEDGNATAVLDVTADIPSGEAVTISGLALTPSAASSADSLELELDNAGTAAAEDDKTIEVKDYRPLLSSAANQTFNIGDPTTPAADITITNSPEGSAITADGDLRIVIPAGLDLLWDTNVTSVTLTGAAAAKVAAAVTYDNDSRVLVLDVTTDFEPAEAVTISGLAFTAFTVADSDRLELQTNAEITVATDDKTITIAADGAQLIAVKDQVFVVGAAATPAAEMKIITGAGAELITAANDIRITIPAGFDMTWDETVTDVNILGNAVDKVSHTVTYEDANKTLVIDVITDFIAGDWISINGQAAKNFTTVEAADRLTLEVDNAGTVAAEDQRTIRISDGQTVLSSAGNQTFVAGPGADLAAIYIEAGADTEAVTAANDIRVKLPVGLNAVWNTAVTTVEIESNVGHRISTVVAYEDSNRTLVIDVTDDLNPGDWLRVTGLELSNLQDSAADSLELELDNADTVAAEDDKTIEVSSRTAALTVAADLSFDLGSAPVAMSPLTVEAGSAAAAITATADIRVRIPDGVNMTWHTALTAATITGTAAAKVGSVVTYEDSGKTLVLDVTTDFAPGETVTIDGLAFANFDAVVETDNLELEVDSFGTIAAECDKAFAIIAKPATIHSANNQYFTYGAAPKAMAPLTITAGSGAGAISAASDIRVRIPNAFDMTWDVSDVTAVIEGTAANKVSATVTYEDANQTLVLDVTEDFVLDEEITISGLSFADFSDVEDPQSLELELDDQGTLAAEDDLTISIRRLVTMASADNQIFRVGDAAAAIQTITVTSGSGSEAVTAINDLRIKIPARFSMLWDTSDTSAAIGGDAAAKASATVSYEDDGKTLLVSISQDLLPGETLTIGGLAFTDFAAVSGTDNLELELANDGSTAAIDAKTIAVADPALVAHWLLDDGPGTIARDNSGNGNDGTLVNDPLWTTGRVNGALDADGANDYVDAGSGIQLATVNTCTLTAWVKPETLRAGTGAPSRNGILGAADGKLTLALQDQGKLVAVWDKAGELQTLITDDAVVNAGEWAFVAFVRDENAGALYVNGIQVKGTNAFPADVFSTIGAMEMGRSDGDSLRSFDGLLDDVRIYNTALSSEDILDLIPPLILKQPADAVVGESETASFSVLANGRNIEYQWQKNGVDIPDAIDDDYTTPATVFVTDDQAEYRLILRNKGGYIISDPAVLTVTEDRDPPYLVYEPESQTVYEGQSVTFMVYAIGKEPLTYQWQKDNVDILDATEDTLTLESVELLDDGSEYRVIVTNDNGETTSSPAVLTVLEVTEVPTIVEQPESVAVLQGEYASFAVYATGQGDLSYQWQKNGVDIPDAIDSYLDIESADLADNGANITCVVSNLAGSVTSAAAVLTVNAVTEAPTIVEAPANITVEVGQSAVFYVYAEGQGLLTYQWQRNGVDIEGATESEYILDDAQLADSGATFTATVTNAAGSVTSDPAALTVNAVSTPPTITTPPYNVSIYVGEDATFSVSAAGAGRLDYQWYKNGQAIEDATSSSYTAAAATLTQSGDVYKVTVSNAAGSVTSSPATLTVLPEPPYIVSDPEDRLIAVGEGATFEVYAQGDGVLRYQWYKNGVAVGPNSLYNKYTVSNADKGDHGDVYSVVVSNKGGGIESYGATLDVNEKPVIDWVLLNDQAVTEITIPVTGSVAVSSQVTDDDVPDWGLGLWYEWFQTAGEGWMFADDPWAAATNLYFSEGGEYEIELYVDDWHLAADPVTATVTVVEFGEIEFDSYSLPLGGSVTASLSFTRPAGRTVQWSISGEALGCSIGQSSGVITPGTQTGTITVVAKDSELGEAYSVTAEIDVISLESFTVLDGSRGIIADQTNSVTASSETIETLLVKKGSNAAVIKMEVGVSPSSVIPVNVLWTITGGSASPSSGNFGGLRPYALLNTAGSYDVKAGCDTNKNNTLDESEVTRIIRVMAVQFTNTAPGNICQNDNDNAGGAEENKGNGTPDKDESGFSYDDQDIIAFSFDLVNAPDYGTLTLSVTTDVLEVWTDAAKSSQPASLSWDLSGQTPPSTLYLEGTAISADANVTLTYTWAGQSVSQVRKMVVLGEGFDSQMVDGCDLYLIPYVDGKPHFGPVCKDQRITFKVVDCRTEEEPAEPPQTCPTDCSGCTGSFTVAFSGFTGGTWGASGCPISDLNTTVIVNKTSDCGWTTPEAFATCLTQPLPVSQLVVNLYCENGKWVVLLQEIGPGSTGVLERFEAPGGPCPPETGWVKVSGTLNGGIVSVSADSSCPTDCTSYPATISAAVAGLQGTCADWEGMFSCEGTDINGSYVLNKDSGTSCMWLGFVQDQNCPMEIELNCSNGQWSFGIGGGPFANCAGWTAPDNNGYPPESGWTKSDGEFSGGTLTLDVDGDGVFGEEPGGSGSGPDPAHENNATVTELIVNGGSNVSGTSASTERTATARTPGENQLSAQATVEWNGETHTKTVQLTVVEITGIEYSENGGQTWGVLPKQEPEEGSFARLAGDPLVVDFRLRHFPTTVTSGELAAIGSWDLTNLASGHLDAASGPSVGFHYDHRMPYRSAEPSDVKVLFSSCSVQRPIFFTFLWVESKTVAMAPGGSAADTVSVKPDPKLKDWPYAKFATWLFNTKAPIGVDNAPEVKRGTLGNIFLVKPDGEQAKITRPAPFTKITVSQVAKKENSFELTYFATEEASGEYYFIPKLHADPYEVNYDGALQPELIYDVGGGKRTKETNFFHVYVVRLKAAAGRDSLGQFLPGYNSGGKGFPHYECTMLKKAASANALQKEGNFVPQRLSVTADCVPRDITKVKFYVRSTALDGICENASVFKHVDVKTGARTGEVVSASGDNGWDFSFLAQKNGKLEEIPEEVFREQMGEEYDTSLLNNKRSGEGTDGLPSDRAMTIEITKVGNERPGRLEKTAVGDWVPTYANLSASIPLYCKDFGGACKIYAAFYRGKELLSPKLIELAIPLDRDGDLVADAWETQEISEWNDYFGMRGGPTVGSDLSKLGWFEDSEPADPDGNGPIPEHGSYYRVKQNNSDSGKGDRLQLREEYRGFLVDGGGHDGTGENGAQVGHTRLSAHRKEIMLEVNSLEPSDIRMGNLMFKGGHKKKIRQWMDDLACGYSDAKAGAGVRAYYFLTNLQAPKVWPTTNTELGSHSRFSGIHDNVEVICFSNSAESGSLGVATRAYSHRVIFVYLGERTKYMSLYRTSFDESILYTSAHEVCHTLIPKADRLNSTTPTPSIPVPGAHYVPEKGTHIFDATGEGFPKAGVTLPTTSDVKKNIIHVFPSCWDMACVLWDYNYNDLLTPVRPNSTIGGSIEHYETGLVTATDLKRRDLTVKIKTAPNAPMKIEGYFNYFFSTPHGEIQIGGEDFYYTKAELIGNRIILTAPPYKDPSKVKWGEVTRGGRPREKDRAALIRQGTPVFITVENGDERATGIYFGKGTIQYFSW